MELGTGGDGASGREGVLELVELRRRLRASQDELARTRSRLQRVESSSAYQLASALTSAARSPRTAPRTLPRELRLLYRRWRNRAPAPAAPDATRGKSGPKPLEPGAVRRNAGSLTSRAGSSPAASASPVASLPPGEDDLARALADATPLAVVPAPGPVIAGVLSASTAAALRPYAVVNPLTPNDAAALLSRSTADILLVDSAAGSAGPWAHLGAYDSPERSRDLLELLAAARARGVPCVLWYNGPRANAEFLNDAESFFDSVLFRPLGEGGHDDQHALPSGRLWDVGSPNPPADSAELGGAYGETATPARLRQLLAAAGLEGPQSDVGRNPAGESDDGGRRG